MPKYRYIAFNELGKKVSGIHEGQNKEDVLLMLRDNKYFPVKIKKIQTKKNIIMLLKSRGFINFDKPNLKEISDFCRQLSIMLNVGVPIINSLDAILLETNNKEMKIAISKITYDLLNGSTFYKSISKRKDIFPNLLINMIRAGEISGNIDEALYKASDYYEKQDLINNKIKSATIYPILLSITCFLAITFILLFIVPNFIIIFEMNNIEIPLTLKVLMSVSNFLKKYNYIFILFLISFILILKKILTLNSVKTKYDKFKFKIPILKEILKTSTAIKFSKTLYMLISSGVSLIESLDIASSIVENIYCNKNILEIKNEVENGDSLSYCMKSRTIFYQGMTSMINIGEESGRLEEVLCKVGEYYEKDLEILSDKYIKLIEPIMIFLVSIIVGIIVIVVIFPIFNLINSI
ncbi:type IV pilus assembly protein TapC [Gottschalkia purinilytica]|uniref:Type IV pilus assembly protein TapC n=1 Tax=Gottschalkia purinilytica TaxID=1503 RepID=A0A0L0WEG4_GOTPU|nr:type II secretion system F family protein [Gottschalkia purinilytica]KNF09859.1 type IV pilus assembly protein TapC [Gottschalkia purinilytica]